METVNNKEDLPLVLNGEQIIKILGLGRRAGYEFLKNPPFAVRRVGKRGIIKASRDAVFNWLEDNESRA
ncbi:DNA-binding protein [Paenibacillus chitinolyticus]|uniref:DNA-binding protein n=1 Tax=Paenibacillus chitinolyticus TaxID=79263 RepID=UPI002DB848A3|nr:DNA-binding protein [Paenibacillus chitinolyticus]MEC0248857.1 DNA-binding protein [Paenibacillus chitinolyticus]